MTGQEDTEINLQRAGRPKRVTISDVAKRAGVSNTTVSFVMSNKQGVSISDDSRRRVKEAAEALGYRGNAAARSLASQRTELMGLATDVVATPFAGDAILGAQDSAGQRDYQVLISAITDARESAISDRAFRNLLDRQVEGMLVILTTNTPINLPAAAREVPCVLVNSVDAANEVASVTPDEVQGGYDATKWLIEAGHRRIGMINLEPDRIAAIGRREGYNRALQEAGIAPDPSIVLAGRADASHGYAAATQLLARATPPTAIFCATDRIAMGAYDAIKERGLRIPDDISVVGFDDQQLISEHLRPPLSTMRLPFREMTEMAVGMVADSVTSGVDPTGNHELRCPPVERASVSSPPSAD